MVIKKHATLTTTLLKQWQSGGLLSDLLLPLSWITRLVVRVKNTLYGLGLKKTHRLPVPVIVVGNIFVGGTGKTPFVLALIEALRERGWQPGIVSRGYGVEIGPEPRYGSGSDASARLLGDEPALLAQAAPIAVHPDRTRAARCLLQHFPDTTVIIADDGLQHLALGRDIEIAIQDSRGTGNGRLLPAGPLREPASRLNRIDYLVTNSPAELSPQNPPAHATQPQNAAARPRQVSMQLQPTRFIHLASGNTIAPESWRAQHQRARIAAVAGIGHPPRFFTTLEQAGIVVRQTLAFPDHHAYTQAELHAIDADLILMTAKDAAKCRDMQDDRLWALEVAPRFSDGDFFDDIAEKLKSLPVY
ncbi:tetraacyldisaccharide 4'-kinase [Advenella kashmirensis]|uniref:tetraacyldisaccharide 4'-kinase n=1 Tax=Advenella kashmirensis TaxID=310575 RepID=UPI00041DE4E4|nr:tetraacyldisaccharide 4'-kinase [Advenella kashmirensis]